MKTHPKAKECLKCGYLGPRLESYSRSTVHSNPTLRFILLTLSVLPVFHFFRLGLNGGRDECPNCGTSDNFAFWKGEISDEELALWSIKQEAEDRVKQARDRELAKVAVIWLSVLILIIAWQLLKSP